MLCEAWHRQVVVPRRYVSILFFVFGKVPFGTTTLIFSLTLLGLCFHAKCDTRPHPLNAVVDKIWFWKRLSLFIHDAHFPYFITHRIRNFTCSCTSMGSYLNEVGAHDGAYKACVHTMVTYVACTALTQAQQEYDGVHGFYCARVERLFAHLWQWRIVRKVLACFIWCPAFHACQFCVP